MDSSLRFPSERQIRTGQGWRLGYRPHSPYPAMVGGEDWAFELTAAELTDFCRLVDQLAAAMEQMKQELMAEEKIACEAASDLLWLEVSGYPHSYDLRLILQQGRQVEGNWSAGVVEPLLAAASQIFP
jgi:hypothetical protein